MKNQSSDEVIKLSDSYIPAGEKIVGLHEDILVAQIDEAEQREHLNELAVRTQMLAHEFGVEIPEIQLLEVQEIRDVNLTIDALLEVASSGAKAPHFPKLSTTDIVVGSVAGLIAVVLDFFIVGTPEVVKLYPTGAEHFDGSLLTTFIRKVTNGPMVGFAEQLSKICKVPYDVSVNKDGLTPNNHRLRSLSHDPFFGLFFAIFDIAFSSTTFIDSSGCLKIIPSPINNKTMPEKYMAVLFYIGHIISDLFTSRGIPIPGFFLTQFFTEGISNTSIAKIAEDMYRDGYDVRHLASMSTPVMAKNIVLTSYLYLNKVDANSYSMPVAIKEKQRLEYELRKTKMLFIANSIAVSGNVAKFFLPPSCCNPCSLNTPEWFDFLCGSIKMLRATTRNMEAEQAMVNRAEIDRRWTDLLLDEE